ncbi:flagellar hook-length control protein FliK [Massilia sp. NR 4-1]|uniref:flagellar hook-length control protein FliK n=1 Tax=Massilia sp. NR 4-1 TaxID=1678028 RepID=UPI000B15D220|nr:flagellar hook-length control protein FliK [Massilia sp. NR 4-1]
MAIPPRIDAPGVRPPTPVETRLPAAPVGDARQEAFQRSLQSLVGQTIKGEVLSKFNDGSFLVRVANTNARMMLPAGVELGAELPLTVMSANPRPTFQVGTQSGQQAVLYSEGGQLPADADTLPSQSNPALSGRLPSQPGAGGAQAGAAPAAGNAAATTPQAAANPMPNPAAAQATLSNAAASLAQTAAGAAANAATGALGQAAGAAPGTAAPADGARPQSLAATLLSKAPLTPAEQLPALDRNTLPATLSPAARAIANVLVNAYTAPGVPATINGKVPLVPGGAPDTAQLSKQLQDALGKSGLFYESHVAEWAEGKRSLQDLAREPQMQRFTQAAAQSAAETAARALNGPDLSAAQMINQQLHAHEQQRVLWQGEAWPGQAMQWEVRRDEREGRQQQGGREENAREPVWRSGVRFRFPRLGALAASVTIVGEQVHIAVQSDSDGTVGTLRAWASQLQQAMEAAGAPLASLTIGAEGTVGGGDGQ